MDGRRNNRMIFLGCFMIDDRRGGEVITAHALLCLQFESLEFKHQRYSYCFVYIYIEH